MKQVRSIRYLIGCIIIASFSFYYGKCLSNDWPQTVKKQGNPPATWHEHWFEHELTVSLAYADNNVAVYYDKGMDRTVIWPYRTMSDAWEYVKRTYGSFGDSSRLYVVFHQGVYGGGHPASYFDDSHDNRNTIDCGLGSWEKPFGEQIGMPIHEMGHIVSGASHGVQGSPSDVLWGDSKFMEIFNYDVLLHIGREDEAAKIYQQMQDQHDDFPRDDTQWFKNWFYPIYSNYGKAAVLNKYFALLAANFPKKKNAHGKEYTRDLNWGEFVHFWSGAAGVSLKEQATQAFGWTPECDAQFKAAQKRFPKVKYN